MAKSIKTTIATTLTFCQSREPFKGHGSEGFTDSAQEVIAGLAEPQMRGLRAGLRVALKQWRRGRVSLVQCIVELSLALSEVRPDHGFSVAAVRRQADSE